jgi:glycosyltransferase involved in cell wall biosynthesis
MTVNNKLTQNMPLVTVCCHAFNHKRFIGECLDSILGQDYKGPVEIIISDDGSTDGTYEILKGYRARFPDRVRIIRHEDNVMTLGYDVTNYVLCEAKGRYIAFCDCDDYWLDKAKLSSQIEFLESHSDYSATAHSTAVLRDGAFHFKSSYWQYQNSEYDLSGRELIGEVTPFHTSSFVARCCFIPTYQEISRRFPSALSGDIEMYYAASLHGRIRIMNSYMSVYRDNSGGVTKLPDNKNIFGFYRNRSRMWKNMRAFSESHTKEIDELCTSFDMKAASTMCLSKAAFVNRSANYSEGDSFKRFKDDISRYLHFADFTNLSHIIGVARTRSVDDDLDNQNAQLVVAELITRLSASPGSLLLVDYSRILASACLSAIYNQNAIVLCFRETHVSPGQSLGNKLPLVCFNRPSIGKRLLIECQRALRQDTTLGFDDALLAVVPLLNTSGSGIIEVFKQ